MAIYLVTMVLRKETAFPLRRAMERCWKKECCLPGVFCDSGDMPANLLCELNGYLMPCTSCLYGKWVEDVCVGQFGVFVYLVVIIVIIISTWLNGPVSQTRLQSWSAVQSRWSAGLTSSLTSSHVTSSSSVQRPSRRSRQTTRRVCRPRPHVTEHCTRRQACTVYLYTVRQKKWTNFLLCAYFYCSAETGEFLSHTLRKV